MNKAECRSDIIDIVLPKKKQRLHRLAARYVFWRYGYTHWSSGPGNYTYDQSCPLCRVRGLWGGRREINKGSNP